MLLCAGATAAADPGPGFTMWSVSGERNQVYLLGSVHLLRQGDYPLPTVIDAAYADAEGLVMELDMDDLDPFAMQATVNRLGMLPPGQSLEDVLGPTDYATADRAAAELEVPLDLLARSEPWLAAITIEQLVLTRLGFNPQYGVEMTLAAKASADGKPIDGLESVDEQLGFLDGLSAEAQRDLLLQTLAEGTEIESLMDDLIAAWKSGDIAFLEANMLAELAEYPELYRSIVADRNDRWLTTLEELLDDDDDYLVIVGALHLIGTDGLPQQLTRKGHDVVQLGANAELPVD
jgi:uncharacterized protein YbaP (TraB family)